MSSTNEAPDLAAVFEHYGVTVTGQRQMVRCPVHEETTPSCSVNLDKGLFKCFACPAAGDAYSLVMAKEDLPFPEAKRFLEEEVGVKASTRSRGRSASSKREKYVPSWKRR